MMNQAVFISDLHLHPEQADIYHRFQRFVSWAKEHTQSVYILGDFFHVWVGDDLRDAFVERVLADLKSLLQAGISIYFMPGNRDFLLGDAFLEEAGLQRLSDPCVIYLDEHRYMLSHGDAYCRHDWPHIILRTFTRPAAFRWLFAQLPKKIRQALVHRIRRYSQAKLRSISKRYQIVDTAICADMHKHDVVTVIYGHIHQAGQKQVLYKKHMYWQYILSDWDNSAQIICYNRENGLYFQQID